MDNRKSEEQRYRSIFENMRNGVAVYQPVDDGRDFVLKDFNKAAERLDGVRKGDLIGKRLLDVFPNADKFGVLASLQRAHQTGEPEYLPASYYEDEHRKGWRENFICRLPDGEIVAIYDDITERKRLEDNIPERDQKFRAITDSALDAIILINDMGEISFWNPASETNLRLQLFGGNREKRPRVVGSSRISRRLPNWFQRFRRIRQRKRRGTDYTACCPQKKWRGVPDRTFPLQLPDRWSLARRRDSPGRHRSQTSGGGFEGE